MRAEGRAADRVRPLRLETELQSWAEGAALVRWGQTTVLCTATVEERVPPHRRGSHLGWVTAEYGMLPRATLERNPRERARVDGRAQEIQRLVARSLRGGVDMALLGERTVIVDCDVIHADGGTRTASINGGFVALELACRRLLEAGMVARSPVQRGISAVSVGLVDGELLLDLDYAEDSRADTDLNLVMSSGGEIIEIQGTAEGRPLAQEQLGQLLELGRLGIEQIWPIQSEALGARP